MQTWEQSTPSANKSPSLHLPWSSPPSRKQSSEPLARSSTAGAMYDVISSTATLPSVSQGDIVAEPIVSQTIEAFYQFPSSVRYPEMEHVSKDCQLWFYEISMSFLKLVLCIYIFELKWYDVAYNLPGLLLYLIIKIKYYFGSW